MYANKRLTTGILAAFCITLGSLAGATCSGVLSADRAIVESICKQKSDFPDDYNTAQTLILIGVKHKDLRNQCGAELIKRMARAPRDGDRGLNELYTRLMNRIRQHNAEAFAELLEGCDFKEFSDAVCEQAVTLMDHFVGDSAAWNLVVARRIAAVLHKIMRVGDTFGSAASARTAKHRIESLISDGPARAKMCESLEDDCESEPFDLTPTRTAFNKRIQRKADEQLLEKAQNFLGVARKAEDTTSYEIMAQFSQAANDFVKVGTSQPDLGDACVAGLEELERMTPCLRFVERVGRGVRAIREKQGKDSASCYSVDSADSTSIADDVLSVRSVE